MRRKKHFGQLNIIHILPAIYNIIHCFSIKLRNKHFAIMEFVYCVKTAVVSCDNKESHTCNYVHISWRSQV